MRSRGPDSWSCCRWSLDLRQCLSEDRTVPAFCRSEPRVYLVTRALPTPRVRSGIYPRDRVSPLQVRTTLSMCAVVGRLGGS